MKNGLLIHRYVGQGLTIISREGERMHVELLENGVLRFVGRKSGFLVLRDELVKRRERPDEPR